MRVVVLAVLFATSLPLAADLRARRCRPNDIPCDPPASMTYPGSRPPFDAPVTFGGVTTRKGEVAWRWIKAGDPSRSCTAQEASDNASYQQACAARIGDVLYITHTFLIEDVP